MTEQEFDKSVFKKGTILGSDSYPTAGREFEVVSVYFNTREVLGRCLKGHFWFFCKDILYIYNAI